MCGAIVEIWRIVESGVEAIAFILIRGDAMVTSQRLKMLPPSRLR